MTAYFLIKGEDPHGAERIELAAQTLVGRTDECDLKVSEGHPSRRHAMLTIDAHGLWVEDLDSANGTRVNGHPISARTLLGSGDQIAFDLAQFVVECPLPAPTADSEATVVRHAPASDATVVRAAPPARSTGAAAEPAAEIRPLTSGPRSEADALQKPVPRSWADPEYQSEGTRILTADEMRALSAGGGATSPTGAPAPMHTEGPHLVILSGAGAGTTFPLTGTTGEWTIGTAPERNLRLDYAGVSAFHAKINQEAGRWRIIDQMSANGTWVNGQKSTISYLQNGDKLRFAQVECEVRLPAAGAGNAGPKGRSASRMRSVLIGVAVALVTGILLYAASRLL